MSGTGSHRPAADQPSRPLLDADLRSASSLFAAMADLVPAAHLQHARYSELDFEDLDALERGLAADRPVVASYTHHWLVGLQRLGDFFVTWTFGGLGCLLLFMLIAGLFGLVRGNAEGMLILCGASALAGLVLAFRYAHILPPMAERSIVLIDGRSRELIYACPVLNDEPVERLVRIPLRDLVVELSWGQYADHSPSFIVVGLSTNPSLADRHPPWPGLFVGQVDQYGLGRPSDDLERRAGRLADLLGAGYAGLINSRDEV